MLADTSPSALWDHRPALLSYLKRLVGPAHAEDLVQETFEKGLRSLAGFRAEASLKNWLFRIASNAAIDLLRREQRRELSLPGPEPLHGGDLDESGAFGDLVDDRPWPTPAERLQRQEMLECIAEFVNTLQPNFKTIILLKEIDHLPTADIAEILDLSPEHVRVRLSRARDALRKALLQACHVYQGRNGAMECEQKKDA